MFPSTGPSGRPGRLRSWRRFGVPSHCSLLISRRAEAGFRGQTLTLLRVTAAALSVLCATAPVRAQTAGFFNGRVVDQAGAPVSRARVRLVDAAGAEIASGFTDARGAFRLPASGCTTCRVEASLVGFEPATLPVTTAGELTLLLPVAPIEEAVIVSATRSEAPTSQIGNAVTVFTAADIERRAVRQVADLLRSAPGATVVRVGGLGNVTSLFVRGGESSYNKVLLDGIPLNEPGGTFNFSNLTTENLERVEVLRGAHSALFGSDAMASVVQLVSARARGQHPSLQAAIEAGTYDTWRGSASLGGAAGRVDGVAHVSRQATDNRVPNNEHRNTTVSLNGGVTFSPDITLRFVGRGELGRTGTPGATAFGRPDLDAFFRRRDGVGGVTLSQQLTQAWSQRASYALTVSHQESTNLQVDPPYVPRFGGRSAPFTFSDFPFDSRTNLRRHHASYQSDWRVSTARAGEHLLTFAFDWDGERGVLGNRLAGTTVRADRDNVGWSLQHQVLAARVSLTTGLRIEHNDSFGTDLAPRVSFAYMARGASGPIGETKLKASAGYGVKEPTLLQSFSPSPSFLGNPDLEPERSRTVDAGIEQRLFRDRAKIEFVAFDGRFDNLISTRTLGFNPFRAQYFNIGRTRARGTELAVEVVPAQGIRARAGHTFLASRITRSTSPGNVVFEEGRALFRRPRHSGFVELTYDWRALGLDVHGTFTGERIDSDFASLQPPMLASDGYAVWDAGATYRLTGGASVYARIDNLADTEYMEPLGYPAWGRTVRGGLRVAF
jgi:outer membrane cobalamin receptor